MRPSSMHSFYHVFDLENHLADTNSCSEELRLINECIQLIAAIIYIMQFLDNTSNNNAYFNCLSSFLSLSFIEEKVVPSSLVANAIFSATSFHFNW